MSEANVERLNAAYELLNTQFARLKGGDLAPLLEFFDPDVVIEVVDAPDPETYRGHDGVGRWFNDAFGVWDAVHVESEGFEDLGQWTVALLTFRLHAEISGVELEVQLAALHQFRNDKILRDRVYLDRDEALAVGKLKE